MATATLVNIVVGFLVAILIWTVNTQKSALQESIKELAVKLAQMEVRLMSKELCEAEHKGHQIAHTHIENSINGIGKKVARIDERVTELERGVA